MITKEQRTRQDHSWKWMLAVTGIITIAVIILSVQAGLHPSGSMDIIQSLSGPASAEAAELLSRVEFTPPALCGFIINPQSETNYFDFVLDTGDGGVVDKEKLTPETKELINYFFLGLTLPAREFWVNLNPIDLNNIISPMLICTDTGKALLETDLRLKRDAAMLTDPRLSCGKEYWDTLKAELKGQNLSNIQIPANTRLWIIPEDAVIEEDKDNANKVTLVSAKLKVCLESEYSSDLSPAANTGQSENDHRVQEIASQAMKKVILPIIEFRVNHSKDYARLRQIYHSLILAEYFKHKYWGKQSLYESYINTCSLTGLESPEQWSKQAIFDSYVQSMTKGEYSCVQREYDPAQAATIRKHYFSGGLQFDILPQGFAGNMQEIPAVITSGEVGTTFLARATTGGAGAGEELVVKRIELLTPEETAQNTAASPVQTQLTKTLNNTETALAKLRNEIAEISPLTNPAEINAKAQELVKHQQEIQKTADAIQSYINTLTSDNPTPDTQLTPGAKLLPHVLGVALGLSMLSIMLKACSSPINQEELKQLDQQATQLQEQLATISSETEQTAVNTVEQEKALKDLSDEDVTEVQNLLPDIEQGITQMQTALDQAKEAQAKLAKQQSGNDRSASSDIVQAPKNVGGIDLRKIRYRVVFSEG
ncbi:MAG: hypothetical protein V1662_02610 [Candidatus Omnitrophota bacterium]